LAERLRLASRGLAPATNEMRLALFRQVVREYGLLRLRQPTLRRMERALSNGL
jgi:hypothetical protein